MRAFLASDVFGFWADTRRFRGRTSAPLRICRATRQKIILRRTYVIVAYGEGHNYFKGGFMMGHIIGKVPARALFVIGAVTRLTEKERDAVQKLGDPGKPFFVDFSMQSPGELQFGGLFYSRGRPLDEVLSGLIYLGPEADVRSDGSVELSPDLVVELRRRRGLIMDDRYLDLQFDNRQHWFDTSEE